MNFFYKTEKLFYFRLYDTEDEGRVDRDDLANVIVRLCEFTKCAKIYWSRGGSKRSREMLKKTLEVAEKPVTPTKSKEKPPASNKNATATGLEENMSNVKILSSKMEGRVGTGSKKKKQKPEKVEEPAAPEPEAKPEEEEEELVFKELDEEEKLRAKEVVKYLDANGDGFVSKDEFVQGCLDDEDFFGIASSFHGELIWGQLF